MTSSMLSSETLSKVISLGVGVFVAALLSSKLNERRFQLDLPDQKAPSIRTVIKKAPTPSSPPTPTVVEVTPIKSEIPVEAPRTANLPETPPVPEEVTPPVEVVSATPLPTLSQPTSGVVAEAPEVPLLPPIAGADKPPLPDDTPVRAFNDSPGGSVLVLGLLLNDRGVVIDTRILVPSSRTLDDMAFSFAVKGQKWTDITPPLRPGETRWLELRIPYSTKDESPVNTQLP